MILLSRVFEKMSKKAKTKISKGLREKVANVALNRFASEGVKEGSLSDLQALLQWVHADRCADELEEELDIALPEIPQWTLKKRQALEGVVAGMTSTKICRTYDISQTAVLKYKADPEFTAIVQDIEQQRLAILARRRVRIGALSLAAVETALTDPHASHSERIQAAKLGADIAGIRIHKHEVNVEMHSPEYTRSYAEYERSYDVDTVTDADIIAAIEGESP